MKHSNSNWYFNAQLNRHKAASGYWEIWGCLARERGADRPEKALPMLSPEFSKIQKTTGQLREFLNPHPPLPRTCWVTSSSQAQCHLSLQSFEWNHLHTEGDAWLDQPKFGKAFKWGKGATLFHEKVQGGWHCLFRTKTRMGAKQISLTYSSLW